MARNFCGAALALVLAATPLLAQDLTEDVVLFDFESGYGSWSIEGGAFGRVPAPGALPNQMPVSGFCGNRLANSFAAGDRPTGRLLSREFRINRSCMSFLVGGGDQDVSVRLLVEGTAVFEATGERSEFLRSVAWDLRELQGKSGRIEIIDDASGAWGHILADHFTLTNDRTVGPPVSIGVRRRIYDPREGRKLPWALNDHCFIRDRSGLWHMFAIAFTEPGSPELDGRLFAHAVSPSLPSGPWKRREDTLEIAPSIGETQLWAPHVVHHRGLYHLFYHAGGADMVQARMHLALSPDLKSWKRHRGNPLFTDGFQARDPFVRKHDSAWVMYYTATMPAAGGHHTVAVRTSSDLRTWSEPRVVYRDARIGTDYGPTESPHVVRRGEHWYLFVGSSVESEYDVTRVFRSRDPFNWSPSDHVANLRVHGCEIVRDTNGRWYASHAGNARQGLWIAPIYWNDGLDEDGD